MEMVGISRKYWILLAASLLAFSCTKELEQGMPESVRGDYDPVVRFGLETYVGADEPLTKTTYAGDDQTYLLNSVRYERINWNVKEPTSPTDPPVDVVQIKSENVFTKNNQTAVDYKAVKIPGRTNQDGTKDSEADTAPVSGDVKDNLYWNPSDQDRYFYAVYPSPNVTGATVRNFNLNSSLNSSSHTATVEGEIPAIQPYSSVEVSSGSPAVIEYMPNMANAYMYAAAVVPDAEAGYKKVPLRFKPLFSAVKLIITARDDGMKRYRLKKVELRTDLHYNDVYLRLNPENKGTALGGKFKAEFKADAAGSTENFTLVGAVSDTCKRLTINIPEADRKVLNDDTFKLTFLALPIDQQYMTVDYTFECLVDDSLDPNDPANWPAEGSPDRDKKVTTIRRFLTLQDREKIFKDDGWYTLEKAHKLYVRSGVPEIEYFFDVQAQGNLPRTWDPSTSTKDASDTYYLAENFYSVKSYRDSSGVKQPLEWKITGYRNDDESAFSTTRPGWLYLEKDTDKGTPADPNDNTKLQGGYSFVSYDAGALNNGDVSTPWDLPVSYFYRDLNGNYAYPDLAPDGSANAKAGQSYAYDLSSHTIYGGLHDGLQNGDLGYTANCYVVSAPGWYRFPAVYGNAIRNGGDNEAAYNKEKSAGDGIMGAFLDHLDNPIDDPWIPYDIESVDVLWDDANHMVAPHATKTARADRGAFCVKIGGNPYIYFYVDDIAQGNALIAAKSAGKIVWSWHIWAVSKPGDYLKTITLQCNESALNPYLYSAENGLMPTKYATIQSNEDLITLRQSYQSQDFWKTADLGQNGKETVSQAFHYCDVEFTQYFKGKELRSIVRRFLQSGVEDSDDSTPGYAWGRKDPFQMATRVATPSPPLGTENTGKTIQEPTTLYCSDNNAVSTGVRYDNLWNARITEKIENSYADGRPGGSLDRRVTKTIYDPSPVGFVVPNMLAYSGINPYGPISQVKFPKTQGDQIALNPSGTYPDYYVDFYTDYDAGATYLRKIDLTGEKTIRFYLAGRIRGNNNGLTDTDVGERGGAYYWTSEPAIFTRADGSSGFFGRSFTIDAASYPYNPSVLWHLWPVAGVPDYKVQSKWQRTHACRIRPMVEQ